MPKRCVHEKFLDSVDVARRPIKTCSGCGRRLGTCQHCGSLEALDPNGYLSTHDHPKPCRAVCQGSGYSSKEDMEETTHAG
jgi:hypothetical protein